MTHCVISWLWSMPRFLRHAKVANLPFSSGARGKAAKVEITRSPRCLLRQTWRRNSTSRASNMAWNLLKTEGDKDRSDEGALRHLLVEKLEPFKPVEDLKNSPALSCPALARITATDSPPVPSIFISSYGAVHIADICVREDLDDEADANRQIGRIVAKMGAARVGFGDRANAKGPLAHAQRGLRPAADAMLKDVEGWQPRRDLDGDPVSFVCIEGSPGLGKTMVGIALVARAALSGRLAMYAGYLPHLLLVRSRDSVLEVHELNTTDECLDRRRPKTSRVCAMCFSWWKSAIASLNRPCAQGRSSYTPRNRSK